MVGKGETILFLHGWGQSIEMMMPLVENLKNKYRCIVLDMPGFGNSKFNGESNMDEYTKTIHDFLVYKLHVTPSYIVGHSFGGKVAINYHLKYGVKSIALIASPILKVKRKISYYFKVALYKLKKALSIDTKNSGSEDYKNTNVNMKKFFVSVVNTHYSKQVKKIRIPTLLIYSSNDEKVSVKEGIRLDKKLLRGKLRVIKGDHFAYLTNREVVSSLINNFFKEREKYDYYL
jgi:pimeloyl-ACP methyl ester carboxylesterase